MKEDFTRKKKRGYDGGAANCEEPLLAKSLPHRLSSLFIGR